MSKPDDETVERMHGCFAVEFNNRGWDLTAQDIRADDENREMLQCAYSAAFHWAKIGNPYVLKNVRAADWLSRTVRANNCLSRARLFVFVVRTNVFF